MSRRSIIALLALALLLAACPAAVADVFRPVQLDSDGFLQDGEATGEFQQAVYAHDPAVSADGQYIAFDGYFAGRSGVWRRDVATGAVQPVAVGVPAADGGCVGGSPCDAVLPSISGEGRYISFTTEARLLPSEEKNPAPNVYVRDMQVPEAQACEEEAAAPSQPCPYTLVSAVNATAQADRSLGAEALTYEGTLGAEYGSIAAGRSAMSENGQEVAFVTTAPSNLAGPGTPELQVAVRNLQTRETELVSTERDPATGLADPGHPVSGEESGKLYGAVYSPGGSPPFFKQFNERAYAIPPVVGASISADGSTVAWMGQNVYKQARMLPSETAPAYVEPLWRRISDGPLAPTLRVTGGSEPANPACEASGQRALAGAASASAANPCQGPFAVEGNIGTWGNVQGEAYAVPQLSSDGYTVAFLAAAAPVALGQDFGSSGEGSTDVYVADMHEGLTRLQALTTLTELASGHETELTATGPIIDLAISPDGTQVAFTTKRTRFPLGSPAYVSIPDAEAGMLELFDVDLSNETLTRVTRGFEGGASEHPHKPVIVGGRVYAPGDGALSPSLTADGNLLVFGSTASNLVYGDGNTPPLGGEIRGSDDGGDVFSSSRVNFQDSPAQTYVTSPPLNPTAVPQWLVGVTAESLSDGDVRLYARLPGEGSLSAQATGLVPVSAAGARRSTRRRARKASTRAALVERAIARTGASEANGEGGLVELTLVPTGAYRALAAQAAGITATVKVTFTAAGHAPVVDELDVKFSGRPASAAAKRRPKRSTRRAGR